MLCRLCHKNETAPHSKWRCEECLRKNRESAKKKRDENRVEFNAKMREWNKEYRNKNPDRVRSYGIKYWHSEKGQEKRREYQKLNKEKYKKYKTEWDKKNSEKLAQYYKKYNATHQARLAERAKKVRRFNKEDGGTFVWADWTSLCKEFGNKCLWCGKRKTLTVDHVVPVSQGGRNVIENIQPLCRNCNSRKNNRIIDFRPFGNSIMDWT